MFTFSKRIHTAIVLNNDNDCVKFI